MRNALCLLMLLLLSAPALGMNLEYAAQVRNKIAAHDPAYAAAMSHLIADADKALTAGPYTVTEKTTLAPSKDPRDYVSLAPYYWPDPDKADGLPFIHRDGRHWPGASNSACSDRTRLEDTFKAVRPLNLAFYMTGKKEYAAHSVQLLRAFFFDSKTGMNPNLNFAQAVRGESAGRSFGIIDFNSAPDFLDSITLMEQFAPMDVWTETDRQQFHQWCKDFSTWLASSKNGREESEASNNHGAWFDATASSFASYLGDWETVKARATSSEDRIDKQIRADGTLPRELARTKSFDYTVFALTAFTITTERAHRAGVDLWHHKPRDPAAGDLTASVSYLLHFSETGEAWPKNDIAKPKDPAEFFLLVRSVLDPNRDADLCHRLDKQIAASAAKLRDTPSALTTGPVP